MGIINKITIGIIIILSIFVYILYQKKESLKEELSISRANEKAYVLENSELTNKNRIFQFTIDQLEYYNDSIVTKMNEVRKELKIKDKNLKELQYLFSEVSKTDTLIFKDTLFINPNLFIDTTFKDDWYQLDLMLKYPSTIAVSPSFKSEKYIITSYKKETINPPKKFFLFRWFQRKHKVVEVEVIEKNPYIKNKQQKFIEIVN